MLEFLINVLWAGVEGLFYFAGGKKGKKIINGCKPCYELKGINDINHGKHLTQVIRKLRKQIAVCSFKETTQPGRCTSVKFLKLPIKAPWPSFIEHYFQCNGCKAEYRLSANTSSTEVNCCVQGALEKYNPEQRNKIHL